MNEDLKKQKLEQVLTLLGELQELDTRFLFFFHDKARPEECRVTINSSVDEAIQMLAAAIDSYSAREENRAVALALAFWTASTPVLYARNPETFGEMVAAVTKEVDTNTRPLCRENG